MVYTSCHVPQRYVTGDDLKQLKPLKDEMWSRSAVGGV